MTDSQLQEALRAGADGLYALEAGTGMILAHGTWPAREDFRCFVHVADSIADPGTELASIDWEAAITALDAASSPAPAGKSKCSDSPPASPGTSPSNSGDAVTGIDDRNVDLFDFCSRDATANVREF
jgi:hypothetical protein